MKKISWFFAGTIAWTLGAAQPAVAQDAKFYFYDPLQPGLHQLDKMVVPELVQDTSKLRIFTVLEFPGKAGDPNPTISLTLNDEAIPAKDVQVMVRPNTKQPRWIKIRAAVDRDKLNYSSDNEAKGGENPLKVSATLADGTEIEKEVEIKGAYFPGLEKPRVWGTPPNAGGFFYSLNYKLPPQPVGIIFPVGEDEKYGATFQILGQMEFNPFKGTYATRTTGGVEIAFGKKQYSAEVGSRDKAVWKDGKWKKTESVIVFGLSRSINFWEKSFYTVLPPPGQKVISTIPFFGLKLQKTLQSFGLSLDAEPSLYGEVYLGLTPKDDAITGGAFGGELDLKLSLSALVEIQAVGKFGVVGMVGGKLNLDIETPPFELANFSGEVYLKAELYFLCFESHFSYTIAKFNLSRKPPQSLPPIHTEPPAFQLATPPPANEPTEYAMARLRKPAPRASASSDAAATALFGRLGSDRNLTRNNVMRLNPRSQLPVEASATVPLVLNPPSFAWPALASNPGNGGMLSIFGVDTRTAGSNQAGAQFSKLRWTYFDNGQWSEPIPLPAGNGAAQVSPVVEPISQTKPTYVAAWQQLQDPNFNGSGFMDWVNQTQVAVGVFRAKDEKGNKINRWESQMFGSPDRADISPKVAGRVGIEQADAMVLWTSASLSDIQQNSDAGLPKNAEFRYALYRDGKWLSPDPSKFLKTPKGLLSMDFTARATWGWLVYSEDIGNGNSRIMMRIYRQEPGAGLEKDQWLEPEQISSTVGKNLNPKVIVADPNMVFVVWMENNNLVGSRIAVNGIKAFPAPTKAVLRPATDTNNPPDVKLAELYNPVVRGGRHMAVSWTEQTPHGPSIMSAVFDSQIQKWSKPIPITPGEDLETLYATTTDTMGNLVPIYVHTDLSYGTVQAPDKNGEMVTVENAPIPGKDEIRIGRFRPTRDLKFADDGLTTPSESFAAGTTVKLVSRVKGEGMLGFPPVEVAFYHGDPKKGGKLIATKKSADALPGGETVDVSVDWKLAEDIWDQDNVSLDVYAVIQKPQGVTEWNPDNNIAVLHVDEIELAATARADKARHDGSGTVEVKIQNTGFPATDPFPVMVYDYSGARQIVTEMVPKVGAGGVTFMNLELPKDTVRGANGADFLVKVDPENTLKLPGNPKVETRIHVPSAGH